MRHATTDPGGRAVKVCRQTRGSRLTFRFIEQSRQADLALRKSLPGLTFVAEAILRVAREQQGFHRQAAPLNFTRQQLAKLTGFGLTAIASQLRAMAGHGLATCIQAGSRGAGLAALWVVTPPGPSFGEVAQQSKARGTAARTRARASKNVASRPLPLRRKKSTSFETTPKPSPQAQAPMAVDSMDTMNPAEGAFVASATRVGFGLGGATLLARILFRQLSLDSYEKLRCNLREVLEALGSQDGVRDPRALLIHRAKSGRGQDLLRLVPKNNVAIPPEEKETLQRLGQVWLRKHAEIFCGLAHGAERETITAAFQEADRALREAFKRLISPAQEDAIRARARSTTPHTTTACGSSDYVKDFAASRERFMLEKLSFLGVSLK